MHYGTKRRSGRYPWGSGKIPFQRSADFLSRIEALQSEGKTERDIADELNLSTTDLRMQVRVAKHERRALEADRAKSLRDDGLSLNDIAKEMGYKNDSSIRSLLDQNTATNKNKAIVTSEILKEHLKNGNMLDVGIGAEKVLGISQNTLKEALFILETEGYARYGVGVKNVTDPKKQTITEVLCTPDITYQYAYNNTGEFKMLGDYASNDGGDSFYKREYPTSVNPNRVKVKYGDEGGSLKDGVIELRRGVQDIDLGNSHYAQVRILVDGDRYLKGMAIYSDDMPDGVDIIYNTNKKRKTNRWKW